MGANSTAKARVNASTAPQIHSAYNCWSGEKDRYHVAARNVDIETTNT
jgi:hypothetical protein